MQGTARRRLPARARAPLAGPTPCAAGAAQPCPFLVCVSRTSAPPCAGVPSPPPFSRVRCCECNSIRTRDVAAREGCLHRCPALLSRPLSALATLVDHAARCRPFRGSQSPGYESGTCRHAGLGCPAVSCAGVAACEVSGGGRNERRHTSLARYSRQFQRADEPGRGFAEVLGGRQVAATGAHSVRGQTGQWDREVPAVRDPRDPGDSREVVWVLCYPGEAG